MVIIITIKSVLSESKLHQGSCDVGSIAAARPAGAVELPRPLLLYAVVRFHALWCQHRTLLQRWSMHRRWHRQVWEHTGSTPACVEYPIPQWWSGICFWDWRGSPLAHTYHVWSTERTVALFCQPRRSNDKKMFSARDSKHTSTRRRNWNIVVYAWLYAAKLPPKNDFGILCPCPWPWLWP